jgi:hypothetical protein
LFISFMPLVYSAVFYLRVGIHIYMVRVRGEVYLMCRSLLECFLRAGGAKRLDVASDVVDEIGLEVARRYAKEIRVLVGDSAPIPRSLFERWWNSIRVYPGLHLRFYVLDEVAVVGSSRLTAGGLGGNFEVNLLVRGEIAQSLAQQFEKMWQVALHLREEYVADEDDPEEVMRMWRASQVSLANEVLANVLEVDKSCLTAYEPTRCARQVAQAIREKFGHCHLPDEGFAPPEVCAARIAGGRSGALISAPGNLVLAGHYVCWARALALDILEGWRDPAELDSGMKIFEAAVESATRRCGGVSRKVAEQELKRLGDDSYSDNYVRWSIPYRMLFIAMTLPAIGCKITGEQAGTGYTWRRLVCTSRAHQHH